MIFVTSAAVSRSLRCSPWQSCPTSAQPSACPGPQLQHATGTDWCLEAPHEQLLDGNFCPETHGMLRCGTSQSSGVTKLLKLKLLRFSYSKALADTSLRAWAGTFTIASPLLASSAQNFATLSFDKRVLAIVQDGRYCCLGGLDARPWGDPDSHVLRNVAHRLFARQNVRRLSGHTGSLSVACMAPSLSPGQLWWRTES